MYLVDAAKTGIEHASFNLSAAMAVHRHARGAPLSVLLSADHETARLLPKALPCRAIPVMALAPGRPNALKYGWEALLSLGLVAWAMSRRRRIVFLVMSAMPFWWLAVWARCLPLRYDVLVHNEIESLADGSQSPNPSRTLSRRWFIHRALTLLRGRRVRVICLSKAGTAWLKAQYPGLTVKHAMLPTDPRARPAAGASASVEPASAFVESAAPPKPLTVVVAGTLADARLQQNLLDLVEALEGAQKSPLVPAPHGSRAARAVQLLVVGGHGLSTDLSERLAQSPLTIKRQRPQGVDAYYRALSGADAMAFLPTPAMYRFSESSVLFDAASVGLPCLSLRCGAAEALAQRQGTLFTVVDDVHHLVATLLSPARAWGLQGAFLNDEIGALLTEAAP